MNNREHAFNMKDWEVRATLEGQKTQARRPVQITQRTPGLAACLESRGFAPNLRAAAELCPFGQPRHRLWVREKLTAKGEFMVYAADGGRIDCGEIDWPASIEKRKSIISTHMPRWASRITLEITGVGLQRVQDISREDELAEVVPEGLFFDSVWDRTYGTWDANPWVWVITFRRITA